jgi:uncharacterized protein YigE (DUF2233 family)
MRFLRLLCKALLAATLFCSCSAEQKTADDAFVDVIIAPTEIAKIELYWKDENGEIFKSLGNVKTYVEKHGKKLRFAMNGGMYQEDQKPLGLFIQDGKTITPLNTRDAQGNFYLKPNGVFGITTDGTAFLVTTESFKDAGRTRFATQSGPMLLVEGQINEQFAEGSDNLNIRNGVCVHDDGRVVFAISKRAVNFHDFAVHFQNAGCRNALYLDGFVSRMYAPNKDLNDLDGDFGVIIGVTE